MSVTCYHCFARFPERDIRFRCSWHKPPLVFPWHARFGRWTVPSRAPCPREKCWVLSGYKVCPQCYQDLPYYIGHCRQKTIAVAGCRSAGKSIYLTSLIYQLRERLARDVHRVLAVMFEDDASYAMYHRYYQRLVVRQRVLEATQAETQRATEEFSPLVVRLLRSGRRRTTCVQNLVFFDPAGELFHSLSDIRFVRYLGYSSAILFLVDIKSDGEADVDASTALANICQQVRRQLNIRSRKLPQALAVALTKCDDGVFQNHPPENLVPGHADGHAFWGKRRLQTVREARAASRRCRVILQASGRHNLVAVAERNFASVRYFALSSLGTAPQGAALSGPPSPLGVEHPLYWALRAGC